MPNIDFNVEGIDHVTLHAGKALAGRDLMSPYVWEQKDGDFGILVRAVPQVVSEASDTGAIYYGVGKDGLNFHMDSKPVLSPGPDALDIGGCEDPTPVMWDGQMIVYYTGVDATRASGNMLYAVGPDVRRLEKMGIALASSKTAGNTKEATISRTADGHWRLFYEYARDDASLIGLAMGDGVAGPWREKPAPFAPRPKAWDSWHLSTGPMLTTNPDRPVMFYNGATQDARWRIGWVAFNRDCTAVVDRCIEPLIVPPPPTERTGVDIAFAASVIHRDGMAHLYYSLGDKVLRRAMIRRSSS
ncbi:MAG: glycosidase [Caulobacter sp.]|nr:glycosidase [Caulobacter sp.]